MKKGIPKNAVLLRVYTLIVLLIVFSVLVASVLLAHSREQQRLFYEINHYHTPAIYYTGKLLDSLQYISQYADLNKKELNDITKKNLFSESINNPLYSINSQIKTIRNLDAREQHQDIDNAKLRLEKDIKVLTQVLNEISFAQNNNIEVLPDLIQSVKFRAQQFRRLHIKANKLEQLKLAKQTQDNTTNIFNLITLTVVILLLIIFPLILNINKMIRKMQQSEHQQRQLKEIADIEKSRMTALLSAMNIGILFEDNKNRVEYINPAFKRMWALEEGKSLIGHSLRELLDNSPNRFPNLDHSSKYVLQVLDTHEISERFEINLNDGRVLAQLSYPVLDDAKGVIGRLWVYEDITHERQTAQQLLHLAEHDHLTGLFNRHRFQKELSCLIDSCSRRNEKFALLYFDLDEFKFINDTYGHGCGDNVLLRTSSEINAVVRGAELFARLGGDEFAVLIKLSLDDKVGAIPDRITSTVASIPFRFQGNNLRVTASVGVAIFPEHGDNGEDLVAHADTAMYHAKKMGKNTWAMYNPERDNSELMVERMNWSRRIALALEQNLLVLHFQGIYKTENNELSHLEVLVRMYDPAENSRLIMPGEFIPFAEKTGQIVEIDRVVLSKSIEKLAEYPELPALAVNISGRSFDEPSLPDYIREQLILNAVKPERLIVELTETETVSDIQDAQRFIEAINQAGCSVCLDDFGSGYSTFTYLKYLDVHTLKIDGMFVSDLINNHENQVFVKAMISIVQGLGKSVVAEFVENAETLELLKEFGVQLVQGYYLDRPTEQHEAFLK